MDNTKKLFDFLESHPNNTIEVWDVDSDKVVTKKFRPDLKSFDAFRSEMKSFLDQYSEIAIQRFKKNGNAPMRYGAMLYSKKKQNTDVDRGGNQDNPAPRQHQNNKGMSIGMNGQIPQGLSFADIGKLTAYDEVKSKKEEAEKEIKAISEKNRELELELNRMKWGKESKPGAFDKLMDNPEVLTQLLMSVSEGLQKNKGQSSAPATSLNAPQLSALKQKLIQDLVKFDPDDTVVQRMAYVLMMYQKGNTSFINEFEKLYNNATSQH